MNVIHLNIIARNYPVIFLVFIFFMIFSSRVNAICNRDDVTFYLDKGFSTDQIAALCGASSMPFNEKTQPESQSTLQLSEQHSASPVIEDTALFLKRAIKAQKINLSQESLQYTQKICIEYGVEDLYGFTPKVCPQVEFNISFKGLRVLQTGKRYYFYGTPEVRVKSTIKREIIGNLRDSTPAERKLIQQNFEQGDETAIPVRVDFSLERVKQILQQLSN